MKDGTIVHDRNLDFAFAPAMRNMTFIGKFYKGDEYLFDSTMFAGYNGMHTGERPGAYSISINERKPSWRTDIWRLVGNFAMIFAGYQQNTKLIRDTLIKCTSYECAYDAFHDTVIIAPCYYILAGTQENQGVVLTRDRFAVAHKDQLSKDQWFVLQTNDDHWTGVCSARCAVAKQRMIDIGQENITPERIRNEILMQYPNMNEHGIYNALMIPSQKEFNIKFMESDLPDPDMPTYSSTKRMEKYQSKNKQHGCPWIRKAIDFFMKFME